MQIQNKILENKGAFFVESGDERLAELRYRLSPGILTIDHTDVDESLKGKNIGLQLVNHAAEYARANNLKIIPLCPFAKAVFEKRKDQYSDVLYKGG